MIGVLDCVVSGDMWSVGLFPKRLLAKVNNELFQAIIESSKGARVEFTCVFLSSYYHLNKHELTKMNAFFNRLSYKLF